MGQKRTKKRTKKSKPKKVELNDSQKDAFIGYMEERSHFAKSQIFKLGSDGKKSMDKLFNNLASYMKEMGVEEISGEQCRQV